MSRQGFRACVLAGLLGTAMAAQGGAAAWPTDQWTPVMGTWKVEGTDYVQSDTGLFGAWSLWQGGRYTDADVQVRFKIEPKGRGVRAAGIVVRAVKPRTLFYVHFDSKNNQVLVVRWSQEGGPRNLGRFRRVGLKQGTWHTGRVRCMGPSIRIELDGRHIGQVDGIPALPGRVGVRAGQGHVRFADWKVTGTPATKAPAAPPKHVAWWNAAWRWRVPVAVHEPGVDDREHSLTRVRVDFGGRAQAFAPRADGAFGWTDVVLVDEAGRRVPSFVLPVETRREGDAIRIVRADVHFPVRVDWAVSARYFIYFGNPAVAKPTTPPLEMGTVSFAAMPGTEMPATWRCVGKAWSRKPLSRPKRNRTAIAAVTDEHHVAFPGICKTKSGQLIVVYRQGYSHASGNPDDGQIMLVRSADLGKTWGKPELVVNDPNIDDRNAGIECMGDGTLVVIFDKYGRDARDPKRRGGHHWAWMTTSRDEGKTWTKPVKISKTENVHTRSRPLDLGNGKWLLPYSESATTKTASSFFAIYDPKTRTFDEIAATPRGQRNIADETAVVRTADGKLLALIRSNWDPHFWQITSSDNGRTWAPGHWCSIPSQFTPCDLVRLTDGRLVCSFSFRERRNERLVVSRDHGKTWDVENSIDLFDGTMRIGGDRSYPASVQLDDKTIGTVIYQTRRPPIGGHIWFITTPIADLDAPKQSVLYHGDPAAEAAFALWPANLGSATVDFAYRFTGRFGTPPNRVGILLAFTDARNYTALEYQMGVGKSRRSPTNHVALVRCVDGKVTESDLHRANGDWFNDGIIHRLGARHADGKWTMTLDGIDQIAVPDAGLKPCGIIVRRAAVAVYEVNWSSQAVQTDPRPLDVSTRPAEPKP